MPQVSPSQRAPWALRLPLEDEDVRDAVEDAARRHRRGVGVTVAMLLRYGLEHEAEALGPAVRD